MRRMKALAVVLAVLTMGFYACQKEDSDKTGSSDLGVRMVALNQSYNLPVSGVNTKSAVAESPYVSWEIVDILISSVKLEAEMESLITGRDSIEIEYKWNGPQRVDLLDSTIIFGNFILQPGYYDEIELKVKGEKEDAGSEPVFYMSGNYTNAAGETIPVVVEVYRDIEFKTEKERVEVSEDDLEIISTIQVYLDRLMAGISPEQLDNATLTEGVLVISEDSNRDLFYRMLEKLEEDRSCRYWYKNKNHDDDDDDD